MKHTRKRILSLMMSGIMTASLLPAYLTQISIPAAADDPPASDYTPDTDPTIDFDYANTHNILNAEDALKDIAKWDKNTVGYNADDYAEGRVPDVYKSYNKYPWKHATKITCHEHSKGSIRTLLESTSSDDTFIALSADDNPWIKENDGNEWKPIRITTDKVLDLNGHQISMEHGGNVNNSYEDPRQEYDTVEAFYMTMFEIDEGATLRIIDSSEWRSKGTGKIAFYADWFDLYNWDYERYTHRDLFHVLNGNLIIYGGTYEAGITAMKKKKVSEFSWKKLQTAIGTAVELGVNIAKYATGISTAEAGYQDVLKQVANTESGKANPEPLKTDDTQKNQPDGKSSGRNLSVSEKAAEKDSKIAKGEERGTPEGENTADSEGKAKDDTNTRVAKAKNEIVNQVVNKDGIMGMVNSGFSLVDQIVNMCGTKSYPPISDTIMGTAVRVGTFGTFASYGGTYIGNGSTPDTRNAVVEVLVDPVSTWTWDSSKMNGGRVYIYDGDFKADAGANVFNICRDKGEAEYKAKSYKGNSATSWMNTITYDEHYGVEELFYQNQAALEKGHEIVPEPIHTANIQVRGGTFHCHYNLMNAVKLEKGAPELEHGHTAEPYYRRCPGTSGSVNLGVDSFGEDLIRDGRIQITDNSAGCLVLMDDQQVGDKGLYHYRLYCGDNELRTKSNLKVYPNNNAQANASYSMQLATYYGKGIQTNYIFTEDKKGDNIRSPYRQTENCFDFQLDAKNRSAYSVKPNFRNTETGELDVYGEKTSASEVWYYPAPLDYNGNPIDDIPKDKEGKPLSDSAYGYTELQYFGEESDLTKIVGSEQMNMVYQGDMPGRGSYYYLIDRDLLDDANWNAVMSESEKYNAEWARNITTYKSIRTNMKYFTYKVYQVDPLTRENLNANGKYGGDDPLLTVRYGCAPEETALRCKLPLDEVERRIKMTHPEWKGYRAGEMYRIVLEVEEHIGIGEKSPSTFQWNFGDFGKTLKHAATATSILFRCYEAAEGYEAEGHKEIQYYDTDFTPLQWTEYPTNTHTIPAGRKHTIELRNGKTGMVDWEADARVFDIYYQWWEVDEKGDPLKLLAGTDNIFDDGRSKYNEHGAGNEKYLNELQAEIAKESAANETDDDMIYELKDKAKHQPGGWKLKYTKKDGERFHYANTVDPNETQEQMMNDPEHYPNITGLPRFVTEQECKWTAEQLHMYTAETTGTDILKLDKSQNLTLYNNDMFVNQTDSCYIPKEMIGKRVRVCAVALNVRWPLAYDKKQTFWSHTMEVCDPNSPEGYLNIKTDENEKFGEDVPATFSVQKLRDCYDEYNMVCDITYVAYGKYKSFCYDTKNLITDLSALPTARYPKDFTDQRPDYVIDNDIISDVGVVLHFTDKDRLAQVRARTEDYTTSMITSGDWLTLPPDLSGTFTITPTGQKTDEEQAANISVTSLKGLNAGETISGVYYYAFGKAKSFTDLSIYDLKDLPDARYPAGFTEVKYYSLYELTHDTFVKVTTSKGSEPYRTVYLTEEKPTLTGTVNITYDKDLSYATYDHPVKLSLDDFKGLAYKEEITEVHYKLKNRDEEKVFSTADDPDVFKEGIPSATFPNDFYEEGSAGWNSNRTYTPYVTVVVRRNTKSQKAVTTGKELELGKSTGIVQGTAVRTDIGTGTGLELGTAKRIELGSDTVIERGTDTAIERALTGSTGLETKLSGIFRKNDDKTREETFAPTNYARFQYVVMATSVERSGKEVETVTVSDIQNGKYPYGIGAFYVMPLTAKIGYDFTDNTNTNEKVAVLDENGNIKLTGEPGEATISVKSPDGKTVSKTVRVYQDFDSIEISGIKAPVIGEKLDFDSIKVPEDALYHITDVTWEKGSKSYNRRTVGKDETAAYFEPYTICITIEPNDFTRVADSFTSSVYETQADGMQELLDGPMRRDFDDETNSYLNSYTFWYTYPAVSDHEAKEIDKIYMDFPTEMKEGDNFIKWLEDVNVYTNGYDDGMEFKLTPTYGQDAEKIAMAYGFSASSTSTEQLNYFIKGVQNGLKAEIKIPDKMKETGDGFAAANDIKVYINGEEGGTFARMGADEIWVMAPDTLTITDGEFNPPKKPVYSVKSVDAVVGEPITVKDLLVTDDPKVTIRSTGIQFEYGWEDYMTADFDKGIFTPIDTVQSSSGIRLTYVVEYDEDGDGYPEYQDSKAVEIEKIYATAADVPKTETPPVENYGTAKVIVQNPDGREISKVDFKIRSGQVIPDPDGMFFIGFYDADGKSTSDYYFENGKTYYAKTVAADDFEIHAGVNSAYGFVRMPNGNTMRSIHISADGRHYLVGDYLRDLNPDTEYTLYYKHGADGKVYTKDFRTAKQDYGVMLGHDFVTDANLGNLEQDGWHYDPDTKTLTLKNFTLNDFGADAYTVDFVGTPIPVTAAIASKDALTLNLIGDNRIANTLNDLFTITIFAEKDLTITGNGNLTLTGNAQYDLNSHTGNTCLNGTGTLTFDSDNTAFYPEKGEVLYTNGTIVKIPKVKTSYNDKQYQLGSLIQSKDAGKLNFSDKVHDIKIEAAGLDGKYEAVAESDLAALIQKNDDCEYEEEKSAIRITPVHKDVNKTVTAETHESGTCDSGCTYHLSCDCGHIGEETFIMSAEEHSLVKHAAKAATCEEPGTAEYWECEICGERYADAKGTKPITDEALTVPALGHKLTHHAGVEATCSKAGVIEYWSCETCGERFADENGTLRIFSSNLTVPATGHDWVQRFAKPATCETDGVIAHWVCANCGQCSADKDGTKLLTKEEVTLKAFGHKWSEWTVSKAATETEEGEEVRICSVCGAVETRVISVKEPVVTTTTTKTTTTTAKVTTTTVKATTTTAKATTTTAKATTTTAKATTTTAKATTTTAKATTTTAKATTTTAKATTTTAKATTTTAKATTTTAKVTTTTVKATTTTAKVTTTTAKVTTTTAKATTTTAKATTTTVKATTTTAKATTTTAKVTTTTVKATTTTAKATTTTVKATTTTAKATTTTAKVTTITAKATTTTAKVTTTTAKATTTTTKAMTTSTTKPTTSTTSTTTSTTKPTTTTTTTTTTSTTKPTTTTTTTTTTSTTEATTTTKAATTTDQVTTTTSKTTTTAYSTTETTTESTTTITTTSETVTSTSESQISETTTGETTPTEPTYVLGDVNEDEEISVEDAQLTLNAYVKTMAGKDNGLTEKQVKAADVNEDGIVSVDDAQSILMYYVKNSLSGKSTTWDELLGRKTQAQPLPDLTTQFEDVWIDFDEILPETDPS